MPGDVLQKSTINKNGNLSLKFQLSLEKKQEHRVEWLHFQWMNSHDQTFTRKRTDVNPGAVSMHDDPEYSLFTLPPEIRNIIYRYCLAYNEEYNWTSVRSSSRRTGNGNTEEVRKVQQWLHVVSKNEFAVGGRTTIRRCLHRNMLNLLQVSKQLNRETATIFYRENRFSFVFPHSFGYILGFLNRSVRKRAASNLVPHKNYIQTISIDIDRLDHAEMVKKIAKHLQNLPSLLHLEIDINEDFRIGLKSMAVQGNKRQRNYAMRLLAGIEELKQIRGLKSVRLHRGARVFKKQWISLMTSPRIPSLSSNKTRKRKRSEDASYNNSCKRPHTAPKVSNQMSNVDSKQLLITSYMLNRPKRDRRAPERLINIQ